MARNKVHTSDLVLKFSTVAGLNRLFWSMLQSSYLQETTPVLFAKVVTNNLILPYLNKISTLTESTPKLYTNQLLTFNFKKRSLYIGFRSRNFCIFSLTCGMFLPDYSKFTISRELKHKQLKYLRSLKHKEKKAIKKKTKVIK